MPNIGPLQLPEFPLLLAPMEDVSDPPFRALCKKHGADLMYTEFISSEGLIRKAAKGQKAIEIESAFLHIRVVAGDAVPAAEARCRSSLATLKRRAAASSALFFASLSTFSRCRWRLLLFQHFLVKPCHQLCRCLVIDVP